jgi:glycosyltransferase involved in cell wall biosynthesis
MSLLESMAAGCPVVATAVGGIPDLVSHGVNGLLVRPGDTQALADAVARVLADPKLARSLGRAARATVAARFTPERSLERLGQIYTALGLDTGDRLFISNDATRCVAVRNKESVPGFSSLES